MAKIDPFANRRLRGITETRTFTDPAQPGVEISLTLSSKPGAATQMTIEANTYALAEQFAGPMVMGIHHEGEEYEVKRPLVYQIAIIQTLDAGEPADRYTFEEWVAISYSMPQAFEEIKTWAAELIGSYQLPDTPNGETPVPNA